MGKNSIVIIISLVFCISLFFIISCNENRSSDFKSSAEKKGGDDAVFVDTTKMPDGPFGDAVKYGRQLVMNTAYYIGPDGINGKFLGNKITCNNCHQDAGAKLYSLNLIPSFANYPQYRARENKVLTLAERINNCVMRPHNGKPLPLDSKEMVAIISYLKWLNGFAPQKNSFSGSKNLEVKLPSIAASSGRGEILYKAECLRCHGANGEGIMRPDNTAYIYPPLWGANSYQPGSSMHRVIKQAQWLKANMPYDKATADKPYLSDEQALDVAAFINDDAIHKRPGVKNYDYTNLAVKPIDYGEGPFIDTFSVDQHKVGPFQPIIDYWKAKGWKPTY
ncbi:MAG: c-type cytochrome [Chitinophagaceae bacterium]